MSKNRNILIAVILLAVVAISVVLYYLSKDEKYMWNQRFAHKGDQPYDLSLFRKTLEASYEDYQEVSSVPLDSGLSETEGKLLFYISPLFFRDTAFVEGMLAFADAGNSLFISSPDPSLVLGLMNLDLYEKNIETTRAKNVTPWLYGNENKTYKEIHYTVRETKFREYWNYFDLPNTGDYALGGFEAIDETYINFIEVPHGEGRVFLHTTPLAFTNFHFIEKANFTYVSDVLETTEAQSVLYFIPSAESEVASRPPVSESPLRFILRNPPLKWAWYLILILTVLFVASTMRRRQKAIPIFDLPANETANYLDVVMRFYRVEGKHRHLVHIQEKLLKRHLRNKYRLNTTALDEGFFREAEISLQMDQSYLKQFFAMLNRAKNNSTLSDEDLLKLNRELKEFYKKCP